MVGGLILQEGCSFLTHNTAWLLPFKLKQISFHPSLSFCFPQFLPFSSPICNKKENVTACGCRPSCPLQPRIKRRDFSSSPLWSWQWGDVNQKGRTCEWRKAGTEVWAAVGWGTWERIWLCVEPRGLVSLNHYLVSCMAMDATFMAFKCIFWAQLTFRAKDSFRTMFSDFW